MLPGRAKESPDMTIPLILLLIPIVIVLHGVKGLEVEMTFGLPTPFVDAWVVTLAITLAHDLYRHYRRRNMRRSDGSGYDGGGYDGSGYDGGGYDGGGSDGGGDCGGDGGGDCGGGGGGGGGE